MIVFSNVYDAANNNHGDLNRQDAKIARSKDNSAALHVSGLKGCRCSWRPLLR
jgi:hypothetical protein